MFSEHVGITAHGKKTVFRYKLVIIANKVVCNDKHPYIELDECLLPEEMDQMQKVG